MGRGCALSLLVALLEELSPGSVGFLVVLMANSKRAYTYGYLSELLLPAFLSPRQATADPCFHRRPSNTSKYIWFSLLLLCPGCWCTQILFVPSKSGVCFSKSYWSPVIKFHQPSKSDSLWVPTHFAGSPPWEGLSGVQNFLHVGRTSSVLWSSVCGSPTQSV